MQKKYEFHFKIKFFLLCLFFIILFFCLGIWQLHRYAYKKNVLKNYDTNIGSSIGSNIGSSKKPIAFLSIANQYQFNTLEFQTFFLKAVYHEFPVIFLTNRYHDDQYHHAELGMEVMKIVEIPHQNRWLLVDLGWTKGEPHHQLPNLPHLTGQQRIEGYIKLNNEYQFILGNSILEVSPQHIFMQKIDFQALEKTMHHVFYPFVLRLNSIHYPGLYQDWIIVAVPPVRHIGYAIQWFLMAFVLIIAYIGFSCERKK